MQDIDWQDIQVLLNFAKEGTAQGAARCLNVNETTIMRRIRNLETRLSTPVLCRLSHNRYELTKYARTLCSAAADFDHSLKKMDTSTELFGTIRVTAVAVLMEHVIIPAVSKFAENYPGISLEFATSSQNFNLSLREADIAVRFGSPQSGGMQTLAQRIMSSKFSVVRHVDHSPNSNLWIGYDQASSDLPQARWIDEQVSHHGGKCAMRVNNLNTAFTAARNNVGHTLLPSIIAHAIPELAIQDGFQNLPSREIWLLSHRQQYQDPTVNAVKDWLRSLRWA